MSRDNIYLLSSDYIYYLRGNSPWLWRVSLDAEVRWLGWGRLSDARGPGRGGAPPRPSHTGHIWAAANHDICSLLNIILYQIGLLDTALDESSLLSLQLQPHRTWWFFVNIHQASTSRGFQNQRERRWEITKVNLHLSSAMKGIMLASKNCKSNQLTRITVLWWAGDIR